MKIREPWSFQTYDLFIPEQFTGKVHLALFEGRGEERGEPKKEALLFQSTIDIHIQNECKSTRRRLNFEQSVEVHRKI